jgi:hypothetical protein
MLGSLQAGSQFALKHFKNQQVKTQHAVRFGDTPSQAEARVLAIMNELETDLSQGKITWPKTRNTDGSYAISIGEKPFYLINTTHEANLAVGLPVQLGLISRATGEEFRYTGAGCFTGPSAFYTKESGQAQIPVSLELAPRLQTFFMRLSPPNLSQTQESTLMTDVQDVLTDLSQGDVKKALTQVWKKLFG